MSKYLIETYYTCSFKVNHYLDDINEENLKNLEKRDDGKFVGKDSFGNKYYESKKGKRWVIYSSEIDASKIPVEWYSWMHFTHNKIEKNHKLEKYNWQKTHQENLTGTDKAFYPNKNKDAIKKKYKTWKS